METKKLMQQLTKLSRSIIGDENTYKLKYFHQRHRFPNLNNPSDLSERLISRMFTPDFGDKYAKYADKVEVREYVANKGLKDTLLEHYAVWDSPKEIDTSNLPNKFIIKTNNGCGGHVICRDKKLFNKREAIDKLNESIQRGENSIETHYRHIVPKVFAEELIDLEDGELPTDYKFLCINGTVRVIDVIVGRSSGAKYYSLDKNWEVIPFTYPKFLSSYVPKRTKNLKEMINVAETLSKDFDFVRVDLYNHKGKVYFGELTFTPEGGLLYSYTDEAIKTLGKMF